MAPHVRLLVGWLDSRRSVHNFLKGCKLHFHASIGACDETIWNGNALTLYLQKYILMIFLNVQFQLIIKTGTFFLSITPSAMVVSVPRVRQKPEFI